MQQQQYCLRWNNYQTNLTAVFDQLLRNEAFVDVTLSTDEGHALKCHKVVLSACSSYFASLLADNQSGHPVVNVVRTPGNAVFKIQGVSKVLTFLRRPYTLSWERILGCKVKSRLSQKFHRILRPCDNR
jgi:hypothetical protein